MSALVKPEGFIRGVSTLTAAEADALDQGQANGIDGSAGGSYSPTADINISDAAGGGLGNVVVRGLLQFKAGTNPREAVKPGSLPVTDNQDIGIASGGQILRFEDHTGQPAKHHDMDNTGAVAGDWVRIIRTNTGANSIFIHKDGSGYAGNTIVEMTAGGLRTCMLYYDGSVWRLGMYSNGCTPGVDA